MFQSIFGFIQQKTEGLPSVKQGLSAILGVGVALALLVSLAPAGLAQAESTMGEGGTVNAALTQPSAVVANPAPVFQIKGTAYNPGYDNQSLQAVMDPLVSKAIAQYLSATEASIQATINVTSPSYAAYYAVTQSTTSTSSSTTLTTQQQAKLNQFTAKFTRVKQVLADELGYLILAHDVQAQERSYLKMLARNNMDTTLVSQAFATFNQQVGLADGDFYTAQTIVQTHNAFDDNGNALSIGDAYDTIRNANNAMITTHDAYQFAFATLATNFKYAKRANHHLPFFNIPVIE